MLSFANSSLLINFDIVYSQNNQYDYVKEYPIQMIQKSTLILIINRDYYHECL